MTATGATPRTSRLRSVLPRRLRDGERTTAVGHLEELRWRLAWCCAVVGSAFVAAFSMREPLLEQLNRPLDGRFELVTLGVTEPFMTTVTIAAYCALIVAVPVLLYNAWAFVAPALQPWQRRAARPYLVLAPALFGGGVAFCYLFVLGPAVRFLLGMGAGTFEVAVRAREYYSFVGMTLLGMGLAFLFPLALVALARLELVTADALRRNRRFALLGVAIVAALLPTGDPVSLAIEMVPLLVLYELSVLLVRLQERGRRRRAEAPAQ